MTAWVWVIVAAVSASARAMPKSITLTPPASVTMTLAGLMSRWTMPFSWLYSSASRIAAVIRAASSAGSTPDSSRSSRNVRPWTYSMTM